jgi:ABC-type transport system substrate-binding protein
MRLLHMNTSRPLFSNVRLRRSVNYAIDRPALVAQGRRFAEVNPFNAGQPTAGYLPPTIAGATDFHLYPVHGPDLRRAKELAGHIHATAIMYTPNLPPWRQEAQIIQADLKPLGIHVVVQQFPLDEFFARISRRGEPFDLAVSGYGNGTTDPAQLFQLFDGAGANDNVSHFDDPGFNHELKAAAKLYGTERYREYSRLELELERDLVPAAAFATNASRDYFSARVGCQIYQPVYGMDLAALCLRS